MFGDFRLDAPAVSRPSAVFWLSAIVLLGLGANLYFLVPPGVPDPAIFDELLIEYHGFLRPEPAERLIYIGLTLAAPLIVMGALAVTRGLPARDNGLGLMAAVILGWVAFWPQPIKASYIYSFGWGLAPVWLVLAVIVISAIVLRWAAFTPTRRNVALVLLGALAIVINFGWRVYSTGSYAADIGNYHHTDPALYSLVSIAAGATCLADVLPQYGCYGEFVGPVIRVLGVSLSDALFVMAVVQTLAAIAVFVFCASVIRNIFLLLLSGVMVLWLTNTIFWGGADIYLQYWPLRFLFPALSLLAVLWWQRRNGLAKAAGFGAMCGAACWWNLDTGLVVSFALGGFLVLSGSGDLMSRIRHAAAFSAGFILFVLAFMAYLAIKAGDVPFLEYFVFQEMFFGAGLFMLPFDRFWDAWLPAVALYLGAIVIFATARAERRVTPWHERIGYVGILGIGVFSYYSGRTVPATLAMVVWPCAILLPAFIGRYMAQAGRVRAGAAAAVAILIAVVVTYQAAARLPIWKQLATQNWTEILNPPAEPDIIARQAAYIRSTVQPSEAATIIVPNQAALIATTGLAPVTRGPGVIELMRLEDAQSLGGQLVSGGPRHVFLGAAFLESQPPFPTLPWLQMQLPHLVEAYELAGGDPDNTILHFQRRDAVRQGSAGSRLLYSMRETPDGPLDFLDRPVTLPAVVAAPNVGGPFRAEVSVTPGPQQMDYAAIISSHCCEFLGFVMHRVPGPPESDQYVVLIGDGVAWRESPILSLPPGRRYDLVIEHKPDRLRVEINGVEVFTGEGFGVMKPSPMGIALGSWGPPGREFQGEIHSARIEQLDVED